MDDRKTILHFIETLGEGGAQSLVKEYVKKMCDDYKIVVVTIYDTNTMTIRQLKDYVEVCAIYNQKNVLTRGFNRLFGKWYIPFKLNRIIKKYDPDVIHAHLKVLHWLSMISKKLKNIRIVYTCHSVPEKLLGKTLSQENRAARQLINDNQMIVIALHETMRVQIDEIFEKKVAVVIPNGVDIDYIRKIAVDRCKKRKEVGVSEDAFVVGHIGRFVALKNHVFLISVFEEILKHKKNAFLLMIGTGQLLEEIQKTLKDRGLEERACILSYRDDVYELLHIMDVFLFPSLYEGYSMTLLEAQAAGLKCVVSDTVDRSSIVSDKIKQLSLSERASHWAMAALDEGGIREEYGNINEYDIKKSIAKLEKVYFS